MVSMPKGHGSPVTLFDSTDTEVGSVATPLQVAGTFSATLAGFTPSGTVSSLSVTTSSGSVALPAGLVVLVTNTGTTNTAFVTLSVGAGTAATTDMAIVAGASVGLTVGSNTFINAITSTSTTTLRMSGGTGLVSGFGGGGSSGGGASGAVTGGTDHDASASGVDPVLIGGYASSTSPSAVSADGDAVNGWYLRNGAAATVVTTLAGALIGGDATNGLDVDVTRMSALVAGSALVGKVGIDQTTPGTTNAVTSSGSVAHDASASAVNPALGGGYASAAAPTSVSADGDATNAWFLRNGAQATVLTAAGALIGGDAANGLDVDITRISALVAGSALIGKVGIDQTTPGTTNAVVVSSSVGISQGAAIAGITTSPISAESLSTTPTRTTAQVDILLQTLAGNLCVQPYGLPDTGVSGLTAAMTSTTSTAVTGVGATASKFNYITSLVVGNSHATVGTFVELQDGSGGTTFFTVPAAAVYGGVALTFPKPLKQPTANTALYVKNTTSGANVIVSVVGYQAL